VLSDPWLGNSTSPFSSTASTVMPIGAYVNCPISLHISMALVSRI
jgi:hypothetical protein